LNPVRDAPPEQIRTERFWRIGPKHFAIPDPQLRDRHDSQPIQFGFDGWIGSLSGRALLHDHHRAAPDLAIR
jgi:hypothetical protein